MNSTVVALDHFQETSFVERNQCPVCASSHGDIVYECPFTQSPIRDYLIGFYESQGHIQIERLNDGVYRLIRCNDCRLVYQHEILNDKMMQVLYDEWIDAGQSYEYSAAADVNYFSHSACEILQLINSINRPPKQIKMLDFGMGWAQWIHMAASFGCDVYGAELSVPRIENARRHGIKVIDWDNMPNHEFDVINTEQVFEHIPDPLATLAHLKQCLRPGGLLKINVPNGAGIEKRLKKHQWKGRKASANSLNPVAPLEHINCFNRNALQVLAERADMDVITLPWRAQMGGFINLMQPKASIKSLLKPLYRRWRPTTYLLLRNRG